MEEDIDEAIRAYVAQEELEDSVDTAILEYDRQEEQDARTAETYRRLGHSLFFADIGAENWPDNIIRVVHKRDPNRTDRGLFFHFAALNAVDPDVAFNLVDRPFYTRGQRWKYKQARDYIYERVRANDFNRIWSVVLNRYVIGRRYGQRDH